jgi:hypothetical protein
MLVTGDRILSYGDLGGNVRVDMVDFVTNGFVSDPGNAEAIVDEITETVFPETVMTERKAYFLDEILLGNLSSTNWYFEWLTYQNSGNATAVRMQLNALFKSIIYSREFQLM